jgi:carbamoyl-phosphate synthase large subunit
VTSGEKISESTKARHYKELLIWQRSMLLAKLAYQLTAKFPIDERFGLVSSICRSAVSIPSSIAKGQARYDTRDFANALSYADGYLAEMETQLLLSVELEFCGLEDVEKLLKEVDELQRMIGAIYRKLRTDSPLATRHSPLSSGEE